MQRGFFKIWYKIDKSRSWSRGLEYRGLMLSILQHQDLKYLSHFHGHEIPVGSIAIVVSAWAMEIGLDRLKLTRMLNTLAGDNFITVQNINNRFCLITVVNHGRYQTQIDDDDQPTTNQRPTDDTTSDTTDEQTPIREKESIYSDNFLEFATMYQQHQTKIHGAKAPKLSNRLYRRGAETVGKLIKLDGFEFDYIRDALLWAQKDDFWQSKLLSLASLRKKKTKGDQDLMKFQNVAVAYDAQRHSHGSSPQITTDASAVYGRKLG